ncbi:MAG: alpha/beta hydrolase [Janthinobacterium lividum]
MRLPSDLDNRSNGAFRLRLVSSAVILATSASLMLSACASDSDKPSPLANAVAKTTAQVRADDDMLSVLNALASLHPDAIEKDDVATARLQPGVADGVKIVLKNEGRSTSPTTLVPGVTTQEITIPGPAGALGATVYKPAGAGPFPVITYFHGGGWVIADRKVYDAGARGLAKSANAIVVSVDYRRAPEAKFPAAWDDAFASYRWVASHAASLGGDPTKLALAGESAGGNLAVATAIAARDAHAPMPLAVLAVYPVAQSGSLHTPSYLENEVTKPLDKPMIEWFLDKLLASPDQKTDTRLDLVHANLAGLPPVTIINANLDPLRDDGEMLQKAIEAANGPVERRLYKGVTHEFFGTAAVVQKARDAQAYAGQRMKQAFGTAM